MRHFRYIYPQFVHGGGRFFCFIPKSVARLPVRKQSSLSTRPPTASSSTHPAGSVDGPAIPSRMQRLEVFLRKPRTIPIPRWISPKHYSMTAAEAFGHASFALVAVSYAVDDFLMLRVIAVAGSTAMLVFAYFHPHGRILWLPFKWNALFTAINSYRIGKVYYMQYTADNLPEEILRLRDNNFYIMNPVDFARICRAGVVNEYKKGELIVAQNEKNRYIRVVLDGELSVLRNGHLTYILREGNFVSETGLHTGILIPGGMESCCTVVASSDARVLTWDRSQLVEMMQHDAGVRNSLKAAMSWDVVRKLKGQRTLIQEGRIDDTEAWTERRNEQTKHRYVSILHALLQHPRLLQEYRKELNKYRNVHQIDESTHNEALKLVGWTPEEYERGQRDGQQHDEEDEDYVYPKRDLKWYLKDLAWKIFG